MSLQKLFKQKSIWKDSKKNAWQFYCPLCRAERAIPYSPSPGRLRHYVQMALTTAFFMVLTWNWFSWKGAVAFVPFWLIFETVYRSRVRGALICDQCGFDPFLYLIDVKKARSEVESHWKKKFVEKGIPWPGDTGVIRSADKPEGTASV